MLMMVAFLAGISLLVWWSLWWRRERGEPWVPFEPRRPVPWGLLDLVLVVTLLLAVNTLALAVLMESGGGEPQRVPVLDERAVWAQAVISLIVMAASAVSLGLRYRTTARDLGIVAARLAHDVRVGVLAFLALGPPTYLLQMLLVQDFESKHPLVELLREQPRLSLVAATLVTAVLVAPLTEEYLFRGLLQGWLERLAAGRSAGWHLVWGGPPLPLATDEPVVVPAEVLSEDVATELAPLPAAGEWDRVVVADRVEDGNPFAAGFVPPAPSPPAVRMTAATAYWPTVASAFIFALMHITHGPDWIPLFFFALGLGYLYRQTHRIVPAVVVHFLLNGCSMLMLLLEIFLAGRGG
ncbi:MAG: CPBP family intramembrane metalloprotease [Pirellulaceae bacterium]|nr:CPBP family intramembrane metalloprotease [Pirellulaceae bacterium]